MLDYAFAHPFFSTPPPRSTGRETFGRAYAERLFDLTAGYDFGPARLSLGIQNIGNVQYITYFSQAGTGRADRFFAGRGRTFTLGLSGEF